MLASLARAAQRSTIWLLLLAGAISAQMQTRPKPGVLDGVVTDTSLTPIAGATAWILGSQVEATTDARGRFRIVDLPANQYIVLVRRIGYAQFSSALRVPEGDTVRASFALKRATPVLDTVIATASRAPTRLQEFEDRRKLGEGQFLTGDEIEKLNFVGVWGLLRVFHSVRVAGIVENSRGAPNLRGQPCPFQFFIDGVRVNTPKEAELPSPKELAGIEVYANTATVPLQYKTFGGDATFRYGGGFCGVILLWTKSGEQRQVGLMRLRGRPSSVNRGNADRHASRHYSLANAIIGSTRTA
jgi:Carboxypeptidase regulatory-like domain